MWTKFWGRPLWIVPNDLQYSFASQTPRLLDLFFPLLPQALTKLKVTQSISRKDSQEEEEESNAISQFDAQLRLLEWKLMQAKILASGEEKGKIDDSVINFEIREESNDRNLAAISAASCENTNIELKCQISIHDEEESIF